MSALVDLLKKMKPSQSELKGIDLDKTPISIDGGKDLSKDEPKLKKARGGSLNTKKYSDTAKRN
jgi:hypothetical protein